MSRREEVANRMADAILKRLSARRVIECKDEAAARAAVRQLVLDNLALEERVDADARQLLLEHAKAIKDSGAEYRQLLGKVKEKLARERGFIL
ncbi:MAG: DUF507 family protein [Candidatus Rokuibacteriota bacterium]